MHGERSAKIKFWTKNRILTTFKKANWFAFTTREEGPGESLVVRVGVRDADHQRDSERQSVVPLPLRRHVFPWPQPDRQRWRLEGTSL